MPTRKPPPREADLGTSLTDDDLRKGIAEAESALTEAKASADIASLTASLEVCTNVLWSISQSRKTVLINHAERPRFVRREGHPAAAAALERADAVRRIAQYGRAYARVRGRPVPELAEGEFDDLCAKAEAYIGAVKKKLP